MLEIPGLRKSFGSLGFAAVFGAIALSRVRGEEA
jgi:hypothetical protein